VGTGLIIGGTIFPEIGVDDGEVGEGLCEVFGMTDDVDGTKKKGLLLGFDEVGNFEGARDGIEVTGLIVGLDVDGEGVGGPRHIWKCPRVSGLAQKEISTLFGVNM